MVNILIVSHSRQIAESAFKFISEMKKGEFSFDFVGGINNGSSFGTDPNEIKTKIESLTKDKELLIIYDLGSSLMNTKMALSMLDKSIQDKVQIANCAFIEGTLVAITSDVKDTTATSLKELVEQQTKIQK